MVPEAKKRAKEEWRGSIGVNFRENKKRFERG